MRPATFDWRHFDAETACALARAEGLRSEASPAGAYEHLSQRVPLPDDAFVRRRKNELAALWLPVYPGAGELIEDLRRAGLGGGGFPRSPLGHARYVAACPNSKRVRRLLLRALLLFGRPAPRGRPGGSDFSSFAVLRPSSAPLDDRAPHAHQVAAWEALSAHQAESEVDGVFKGILAMPTGAGKGFTVARWLCRSVLSRGQRVLWIAHRHELLEQAAREIHRSAAYVDGIERLRVRIVSGRHCRIQDIDPADHVVIASIASLSRGGRAVQRLLNDPRLFIVVDEAHHAPARSYRRLIEVATSRTPSRVLGITATPTRTKEAERPTLSRLFGGCILYQIDMRRLVERGILARPRIIRVSTGADVEEGVSDADRAHLRRFGDLSDDWRVRIAEIAERNQIIVDHFVENRVRYGPTVVFALTVAHAALLAEQLKQRGVRADYMASYRPDGSDVDRASLLDALRSGELEVLVNVEMLTEGVDVPGVRTVFLARPTASETLLRQMIGRAMRGPACGGEPECFLVAFEDAWRVFTEWQHPLQLVPDVVEIAEPPDDETSRGGQEGEALPWREIRQLLRERRRSGGDQPSEVFEAVPAGVYVLERRARDDGHVSRFVIPVYTHQREAWEGLVDELYATTHATEPLTLYGDWFWDCAEPPPSVRAVELMIQHRQDGGARPALVTLEDRERCDPRVLAREICERDLGERARVHLIASRFSPLARAVYEELPQFAAAVDAALGQLRFGRGSSSGGCVAPTM